MPVLPSKSPSHFGMPDILETWFYDRNFLKAHTKEIYEHGGAGKRNLIFNLCKNKVQFSPCLPAPRRWIRNCAVNLFNMGELEWCSLFGLSLLVLSVSAE
jgi:hypothetical protein